MLALLPAEMQNRVRRQLAPLQVTVDFVEDASEIAERALSNGFYQVTLIPAVLPEEGWWSLWREIALLDPRPEVVVYAQAAGFNLWSGVLEMGGHDVIVEPFTDKELQGAVMRAAQSFAERHQEDAE